METQYSGDFLASLVEVIHNISHNHLKFLNLKDSIEINGYISVEIDNVKKERYVLSELLQSSGNVVSESFRVKSGKRVAGNPVRKGLVKRCSNADESSATATSQLSKRIKYGDVIEIDDDYQPEQAVPETTSQSRHQIQAGRLAPKSLQSHQREKPIDQYSSQSDQIQTEGSMPQYSTQSHQHVQRGKPVHRYSSQSDQIQTEGSMPQYSTQSHQHGQRGKPVHRYSSQSDQIQTEGSNPQYSSQTLQHVQRETEGSNPQYSSQTLQHVQRETEGSNPQYSSQTLQHVQREKPENRYSSQSDRQIQTEDPVAPYSSQSHEREPSQEREISTKANRSRRRNTSKSVARTAVSQVASVRAQQYDSSKLNASSIEPNFSYRSIINEKQGDALQCSDDALTSNVPDGWPNVYDTAVGAEHSETPGSFPSRTDEEAPSNNYACGSQDNSSSLEVKPCVKTEPAEEDFNEEVIDVDMFDDLDDDYSSYMHEIDSTAADQPAPPNPGCGQKRGVLKNPKINYVIRCAVKQLKSFFLDTYSQDIDIFSLSSQELAATLLDFYQNVRKQNGEKPSARYLMNMHTHLNMYLRDGGSPIVITKDEEFTSCRIFLKSKIDEIGKQQKIQKFVPVDDDDIEQLFQTRQLGSHSLEAIHNTMWFINSKYMGVKRPKDHMNLHWGDITLQTNKQGLEFLEHVMSDVFSFKIHAKPTDPARCFVNIYKQYLKARPPGTLGTEHPFYLNYSRCATATEYFTSDSMTWSRLDSIWKRMITGGRLDMNKKVVC